MLCRRDDVVETGGELVWERGRMPGVAGADEVNIGDLLWGEGRCEGEAGGAG